jgi:hypothetical protein
MNKPQRVPGFVINEVGVETLLYNQENEAIHVLNMTAWVIWDHCDGCHTIEEIERELRDRFHIREEHDVSGDIQRTLAIFQSKGLIEPVTAPEN